MVSRHLQLQRRRGSGWALVGPATRLYVKQILGDFKNYEWLYRQDT